MNYLGKDESFFEKKEKKSFAVLCVPHPVSLSNRSTKRSSVVARESRKTATAKSMSFGVDESPTESELVSGEEILRLCLINYLITASQKLFRSSCHGAINTISSIIP